jgi:hypothetical protein
MHQTDSALLAAQDVEGVSPGTMLHLATTTFLNNHMTNANVPAGSGVDRRKRRNRVGLSKQQTG